MAKRTIVTTTRDDGDDDGNLGARPIKREEQDPAEISYADFIAKNRGAQGCRVKVHRQTPRGRQYCFFGTPEEISEEYVRLYHAKQPYASEEGTYFLSVEVNGELRNVFPVDIAPQVGMPGTIEGANGGMADSLRLMQGYLDRLEQRINQQQQEKPPLSEMLDNMLKLDQLRGGGQAQQLPIESIMKAVEIGKNLNPSDAETWNGLVISTLKENGPMILGMLNRFLSSNKPAQAEGVPVQAKPETERISETMAPMVTIEQEQAMLKDAITFLKQKAVRNSDPGLYVDLIIDNRDDPLYAKLISEITTKKFPEFAAIDAEITQPQYSEFFEFIYNRVRSFFVPKAAVGPAANGKAGNKKHAASNGASSKDGSE
jgi:hypothetical protein